MTNNFKQKNQLNAPSVAVDAVLFTIEKGKLLVLLIKISEGIYKGIWALPGGSIGLEESLDGAAKRILFQKTNVNSVHLEQLYSFGDLQRDLRKRVVSVAYFALVNDSKKTRLKTTPYYSGVGWYPIENLPELAFDHKEMIELALQRLRSKLEYTNIAYSLLPENFTLTDLQQVYEVILDRKIDKRNFRKRMLTLGLVESVGKKQTGEAHRPARLYKFSERKLVFF